MSQPGIDLPAISPAIERAARLLWTMTARAEARDYMEVDSLIAAGINLPTALAAAGTIYPRHFNPLIPLKALCFFEDGDLPVLPADVRRRLVTAVGAVDLDHLPRLGLVRPAAGASSMERLPPTSELLAVAEKTVWFKEPAATLTNPAHFIAYALTYGTPADVRILRKYVDDDDLRESLKHAPPGVFDGRSWTYWNLMMGCYPAPPMPQRRFD